ncbi:methyltransferase [Lentzea sp. NBRC 105346]|uniref:class I SAM-dependent methyltransferase n=1 Tax=Lentzea sp. NBRC 105346 TaxID=3032205 RepID=UPI0024A3B5E4|nr:class I SAM-dependent methyltransferase [Lentzea sp. NBRC 105346]GLZ36193.1 methyltransferase [Lentzea sp. NBRC 105346]
MGNYLFGNTGELLESHFGALSDLLDAGTFARIEQLGLPESARCLEIGGGGGSVTSWLADLVGPRGDITATDLDVDRLAPLERDNVTVLRHDVVRDVLPENAYDLVHARLVLIHLPERDAVLRKLVRALRPGGRLLLDEFDCRPLHVLTAPTPEDAELIMRVKDALLTLLEQAGADVTYGARIEKALRDNGLRDVAAVREVDEWQGGEAGCALLAGNVLQTRGRMPLPDPDVDRFVELMGDPAVVLSGYAVCSAWGTR